MRRFVRYENTFINVDSIVSVEPYDKNDNRGMVVTLDNGSKIVESEYVFAEEFVMACFGNIWDNNVLDVYDEAHPDGHWSKRKMEEKDALCESALLEQRSLTKREEILSLPREKKLLLRIDEIVYLMPSSDMWNKSEYTLGLMKKMCRALNNLFDDVAIVRDVISTHKNDLLKAVPVGERTLAKLNLALKDLGFKIKGM